jgi:hypothetical protein
MDPGGVADDIEAELRATGTPERAQFGRHADALLDEREFFIRKAIGWVLRETGKRRPQEVYDWLAPRVGRASGVTFTEAVKYLPPEQPEGLRQAHGTRRPPR